MVNYFLIATKNLKKRGIRSWLTLLGIFIGVMAVVSLITLGSGLKAAVSSQFGVSSTQLISVQAGGLSYGPPGTGITNPLTEEDAEEIEKINEVELTFSRNIETLKIKYNGETNYITATSIPVENRKEFYEILDIEIEKGKFLEDEEQGEILLGYGYSQKDNEFKKPLEIRKNIEINEKDFEIKGVLKKKGSFIFDNVFFLDYDDLKELVGNGEEVDIISVKVKNKDLIEDAKKEIEDLMRERRDVKKGEEDFEVNTPEASLEQINEILNGIQAFIVIVALISIIVGALGIVNTMTTSVLERTREIGIMKAIGAKNNHIFNQFLLESGLLGLVGGIFGTVFGILIGFIGITGINNFIGSEIKIDFNLILISSSLAGSFLIGAVSGIIPANRASKKNPVEALRN